MENTAECANEVFFEKRSTLIKLRSYETWWLISGPPSIKQQETVLFHGFYRLYSSYPFESVTRFIISDIREMQAMHGTDSQLSRLTDEVSVVSFSSFTISQQLEAFSGRRPATTTPEMVSHARALRLQRYVQRRAIYTDITQAGNETPSSDIVHAGFKFSIEVDFYHCCCRQKQCPVCDIGYCLNVNSVTAKDRTAIKLK